MQKCEFFSNHGRRRTCGVNTAYNFVEFRSNRACWSNYRGASFARDEKTAFSVQRIGEGKGQVERQKEAKSV